MSSSPTPASDFFDRLTPQEIMASYYGYWYRLQDMQALQQSGKRIPGGMASRIELANLHWQLANQALDDLVSRDPAKAKAIQEWLAGVVDANLLARGSDVEGASQRAQI